MASSARESATWTVDLRGRLDELLDGYREALHDSLGGLTEEQTRLRLVPSKTTLLGLLKHVTYVEGVWFDQAVTGRSYREIGIASTPDRSFTLTKSDTVGSVQDTHRRTCESSRRAMAGLALADVVDGRGERGVVAVPPGAPRARPARRTRRHPAGASPLRPHRLSLRSLIVA